jgi:GGDEF domain-containing protein
VTSELDLAVRREFARAARYRQNLSLLHIDLPPTAEVLGRVRDGVRLCDSVVAAPGDRVLVVLPETALAGALLVATRLAGALGPSPTSGGPAAIGVATYPSPTVPDGDGLLRAAGKALEDARSRGGGIMTPFSR